MTTPKWLKKYYGKDFKSLNPKVVAVGKTYAVVGLKKIGPKGFSAFGYVLIKKAGSHAASKEIPLHEGVCLPEHLDKMISVLAEHEGNS